MGKRNDDLWITEPGTGVGAKERPQIENTFAPSLTCGNAGE
ncbi:hypothetical protein SUDANB6_03052 [Streptomyces sp. enrichment culture]